MLFLDGPLIVVARRIARVTSGCRIGALTARIPTSCIGEEWNIRPIYRYGLKERKMCGRVSAYRLADRPDRAQVDGLRVLEADDAAEEGRHDDEDATAEPEAVEDFAARVLLVCIPRTRIKRRRTSSYRWSGSRTLHNRGRGIHRIMRSVLCCG